MAALLTAVPPALARPAQGGWTYRPEADAMGLHGVIACTASAETIHAAIPPRSGKALLCVSHVQQEGEKETTIAVTITLSRGGLIRQEEFRYRLDHVRPLLHSILPADDGDALIPDWPKTFAKHILAAKTLVVEVPVAGGGLQDATFNLTGLKLPDFGPSEYELARCGRLQRQYEEADAGLPPDPGDLPKPDCEAVRRQAPAFGVSVDQ